MANLDVHTAHCCRNHGCKYGNDSLCIVATGLKPQNYPCEYCDYDGVAKPGQIVVSLQIVVGKETTNEVEGMAWMPTEEEVASEIAGLMVGADLDTGWEIVRIIG